MAEIWLGVCHRFYHTTNCRSQCESERSISFSKYIAPSGRRRRPKCLFLTFQLASDGEGGAWLSADTLGPASPEKEKCLEAASQIHVRHARLIGLAENLCP